MEWVDGRVAAPVRPTPRQALVFFYWRESGGAGTGLRSARNQREREREREHLFKRETEHLLPNRRRTLLSAGKTAVFPHLIIAPMPTRLSTYGADRGITRGSTSAVVGGWMQHPPHVFTVCSQCVHCVRLQTNTQHRVHRMVHVQQTRSRVDSMAT